VKEPKKYCLKKLDIVLEGAFDNVNNLDYQQYSAGANSNSRLHVIIKFINKLNIMKILNSEFIKSCSNMDNLPPSKYPEFAVVGRSNVWKSSLVNMLMGKKQIAKSSKKPWKTRLINYFDISNDTGKNRYMVDLPGYGYAKASTQDRADWMDTMYDYLTKRESLKRIFVLIDGNISPQKIDIEFISELMEERIPFDIIVTKVDKIKAKEINNNIKLFKQELKSRNIMLPEFFLASSAKGEGKDEILRYIWYVLQN
jgi:GTP-binding protein